MYDRGIVPDIARPAWAPRPSPPAATSVQVGRTQHSGTVRTSEIGEDAPVERPAAIVDQQGPRRTGQDGGPAPIMIRTAGRERGRAARRTAVTIRPGGSGGLRSVT